MQTIHRIKLALLTALALTVSLGLIACSDESLNSPADPAPQTSLDDQWQTQVDALRAEIGDEAMAELAPQLEQARASLDDKGHRHRARLFLAYITTTFDQTYIYHDGWGTVLGHFTGISTVAPDSVDNSTDPPTQYNGTTHTDGDGDQITNYGTNAFAFGEDGTSFEFQGRGDWVDGTGRYADATGTAWYAGEGSLVTFTGRYLMWGWIDLND